VKKKVSQSGGRRTRNMLVFVFILSVRDLFLLSD